MDRARNTTARPLHPFRFGGTIIMMELFGAFAQQAYRSLYVRGAIACAFGVLCLVMPGLSLALAVAVFGAYLFVDGLFLIGSGARPQQKTGRAWVSIAMGVLSAIAGVLAFYHPGIALVSIVFIIALRSLVLGGLELGAAFALPKGSPRGWIGLSGMLSVVFAVLLVTNPAQAAIGLLWVIGLYAIAYGGTLLYMGYKVKGETRELFETPSRPSMPRFSH